MNTLLIASAGKPQNMLFPGVYDLMIPINGKPTINYILENIDSWKVSKIIILLNIQDTETRKYIDFLKVPNVEIICQNIDTNSLGDSILSADKHLGTDEKLIIQLGDTILNQKLDFECDFISVSKKQILEPEKWTFIDQNLNIYDKKIKKSESSLFLINGIYYIRKPRKFFECLKNMNFYDSLEKYFKEKNGRLIEHNSGYYDVGHLDEYYKSKIDFLRVRSFNSLQYNDFKGIITKKSSNHEKLSWEINWFNNLPHDLKIFTPRLIDYTTGEEVQYSLEFYGYSSVADIFLYSNYSNNYYQNILLKIINYVAYSKDNYVDNNFPIKNFYKIYYDKTFERLDLIFQNDNLKKIYNLDVISINGKRYKNINKILRKEKLKNIISSHIYNKQDCNIIHGDLCFSNILFDIYNGLFKLIDPRGNFGETGIWGDIKYDIAKLRHSIHGRYENIISDLFNLEYSSENGIIHFKYFNSNNDNLILFFDSEIKKLGYSIDTIKFIEGLLYLTMIPLHSDSFERQLIMYATAVILFNETIELGNL